LLERFSELARAGLHLVEQPHVLDGDDRLIREGLDQLDLLLGERPYSGAVHDEQTNGDLLSQERHPEDCPIAAYSREVTEGVFGISKNIGNLNGFALQQDPPDDTAASWRIRLSPYVFFELRRVTVARSGIVARVLPGRTEDVRLVRLAQPRRRFDQRVEYGAEVERRAADDLEHVGGGGLLLQRFAQIVGALAQLVEQAGVLDGDDRLGGKILHQGNLLVVERPHLLTIDDDRADQLSLLEHRDRKHRAKATKLGAGDQKRIPREIRRHRANIVDVRHLMRQCRPAL